jgi:hypothetical protein
VAVQHPWSVKWSARMSASMDASALRRAARLVEVAGHGGDTACELASVSVTDLGRHRDVIVSQSGSVTHGPGLP